MNRRTRTLLVVGLSVVMAGLASFGVYQAIARIPVRQVEVAHGYVAVAARPLPVGTRVTKDDVKLVAWPSRNPVPGSHAKVDEVVGRGVIASIQENEPLTETRLASLQAGAGLPPSIPAGMRAMSVKVNEVIGVAGFVIPGTRVDVLVTLRRDRDNSMSRVVVTNVEVLTAGTRYGGEKTKEGKPIPTTVVTLAVTPEDAERIALAAHEGKIMLTLRNPMDTAPSRTAGVRLAGLMGPASAPAEPVAAKPAATPRRPAAPPVVTVAQPANFYSVEAIRAAKRTEETVR